MVQEHNILDVYLDNMNQYCEAANQFIAKENDSANRKKLYVNYGAYSHHDEIDKRLEFLKFFAETNSNFAIS